MTKEEKQRKIKLIGLIMLCEWVKMMKSPPKDLAENLNFGISMHHWKMQIAFLSAQPISNFENVSTSVGNNNPEFVIDKKGRLYKTDNIKLQ